MTIKERKELKQGNRSFIVAGVVRMPQDGLEKAAPNQTGTWMGVRTGFSVETSEGNLVYVTLYGGRSLTTGLIQKPSKNGGDMLKIPIADAGNEELISQVADYSIKSANLETVEFKDSKKFICDIQYLDYLREHLRDGLEVVVRGNVEYDDYEKDGNTRVYRKLDVRNIYLNKWLEATEADGDKKALPARWQTPHCAVIDQTFLIDSDSISKNVLKELKEDGRTVIRGYVPQYKSKVRNPEGKYVDFKKVVPIPMSFVYKSKGDPEKEAKNLKILFKVEKENVWEQPFKLGVVEGYESGGIQKVEIDAGLQELIDAGVISESDLSDRPVVRGTKRSELVYLQLSYIENEQGQRALGDKKKYTSDDIYAAIPNFETDSVSDFMYENDSDVDDLSIAAAELSDMEDDDDINIFI